MKIATWNVNGIRAREAQLREWLERDRPDVVCLQEIKAHSAQVPAALCEMEGYWCYWHGERAYSGVGLHVRKDAFRGEARVFAIPRSTTRIGSSRRGSADLTVASVYVPNGGKDFPAKMRFLEALAGVCRRGPRVGRAGRPLRRPERRAHRQRRPPQGAQADVIGQRPRSASSSSGSSRGSSSTSARALDPDNDAALHVVGAVAQPAPAQHRLAHRLHPRERAPGRAGDSLRGARGRRDERPRAGHRRVRRGSRFQIPDSRWQCPRLKLEAQTSSFPWNLEPGIPKAGDRILFKR